MTTGKVTCVLQKNISALLGTIQPSGKSDEGQNVVVAASAGDM